MRRGVRGAPAGPHRRGAQLTHVRGARDAVERRGRTHDRRVRRGRAGRQGPDAGHRRTRTILGLLLLTSLTLVVLSLRGGGDGARDTASGFFGPVENAASAVVRPVRDFVGLDLVAWAARTSRSPTCRRRTTSSAARLNTSDSTPATARRSSTTCSASRAPASTRRVPAQVIAIGPAQGFAWTVTIDAGSTDGVKVDQNVVNGQGLVGRVIRRRAPATSVVALLVDATSTVGARVEDSGRSASSTAPATRARSSCSCSTRSRRSQVGDRLVSFGVRGGAYVARHPARHHHRGRRHPGPADPRRHGRAVRRRHDASTSSASSSRRRAPTRATPCCRPSRPRAPRAAPAAAGTAVAERSAASPRSES